MGFSLPAPGSEGLWCADAMCGAAAAILSSEGRDGEAEDGRWEHSWALEDTMEPQNCPNLEPLFVTVLPKIRRAAKGTSQNRAAGVPADHHEADKAWAKAEPMQHYCERV